MSSVNIPSTIIVTAPSIPVSFQKPSVHSLTNVIILPSGITRGPVSSMSFSRAIIAGSTTLPTEAFGLQTLLQIFTNFVSTLNINYTAT